MSCMWRECHQDNASLTAEINDLKCLVGGMTIQKEHSELSIGLLFRPLVKLCLNPVLHDFTCHKPLLCTSEPVGYLVDAVIRLYYSQCI